MNLITGATGLVGTHLAIELIEKGKDVRCIYRDDKKLLLVKEVMEFYHPGNGETIFNNIEWVKGDILDIESLNEAMEDVDVVYHCAAVISFGQYSADLVYKVNVEGTTNIVNLCIEHNINKLCHISSSAAVGKHPYNGILYASEKTKWKKSNNNTDYSISKYNSEKEVWRGIEEGLEAVILNPCVILGPGDWKKGSLQMFKTISEGLKFYTSGGNGFIDARDVAKTAFHMSEKGIISEKFLLVSENLYFKEIFDMIAKEFNIKAPNIKAGQPITEIAWRIEAIRSFFTSNTPSITKESTRSAHKTVVFDNKKIKEELGYEFIPVEESIGNACEFFKRFYA
ncbi:MAG: NAD-dependent epimerase/dehydratase family protein [Flavobacteriales bacterium]